MTAASSDAGASGVGDVVGGPWISRPWACFHSRAFSRSLIAISGSSEATGIYLPGRVVPLCVCVYGVEGACLMAGRWIDCCWCVAC